MFILYFFCAQLLKNDRNSSNIKKDKNKTRQT